MTAIKLITFDLDNTLWNVESVLRTAEERMRTWLDEQVPDFRVRFPTAVIMTLRDAVLEEAPDLRHDLSKLREEILFRAIGQCGFSRQDARRLARGAFEIFLDARHEVEYFEGALDTLARLAEGYVLGALTNGNADISRLEVQRFFRFGYSAAGVGVGKPAPAMFHAALEHVGAAPGEAVHVGDHLQDDIRGAADVGMHTLWVRHGQTLQPDADLTPSYTAHRIGDVPDGIIEIARSLPTPTR